MPSNVATLEGRACALLQHEEEWQALYDNGIVPQRPKVQR